MAKKSNSYNPDLNAESTLVHILELGKIAEEKKKVMEETKAEAKEAREDWEMSVADLQRAIREANDPQPKLSFGD